MQGHNQQLSLSKDKIRILLLEGINDSAVELITGSGYSSTTRLMKALDGKELDDAIRKRGFAVVDMGDDGEISDILHSCDGYKKSALSGASPQASALFRKLFRLGILPDLEGLQP